MYRLDYLPLCTIAGSDPTGGAGLQADLRVFAAHGGHGTAIATAITVQDRGGVREVAPMSGALVRAQADTVLGSVRPAALKIGMLAEASILAAVADALDEFGAPPLVVDPVLTAGAGGSLLTEDAIDALRGRLARHTTLLTPNLPEAARLLGRPPIATGEEEEVTAALRAQGWSAVLLKGGHGEGPEVVDVLDAGAGVLRFARPRIDGGPFHGTGCALSAAIAVQLGRGATLARAVEAAGDWMHALLTRAAADGSWILPHLAVPPTEA